MQLTSKFVILASALATTVLAIPVANPGADLDARDVDIDLVTREVVEILDARAAPLSPKSSSAMTSDSQDGPRSRPRPPPLKEESLNSYKDGHRSAGLRSSRLDREGEKSPYSGRPGSSMSPLRTGDSEGSSPRTSKSELSPTTPKSGSKEDSKSLDSHKKSDVSKKPKRKGIHIKSLKQRLRERKAKKNKKKADRKAKKDKKKADRKAKKDKKKADRKAKRDKKKADRKAKHDKKKADLDEKHGKKKADREEKAEKKADKHDGLRSASLDSPRRPYDNESSRYRDSERKSESRFRESSPRTSEFPEGGRRSSEDYPSRGRSHSRSSRYD